MDGFKDSTKTQYEKGGPAKSSTKGAAKVAKVMGEFKRGELHSGSKSGPEVTSRKQATAIALSEARKAPVKKALGGRADIRDMEQANRDTGGMSAADVRAAGAAIGRGNRTPYERMPRDAGDDAPVRKPRSVTMERTTVSEAPAPRTALDRKLSARPAAADMAAAKRAVRDAGVGSFRSNPLVKGALDAIGLKKGGLASMPKCK